MFTSGLVQKNAGHVQAVRLNWVGLQVCNVLYMCNMYVCTRLFVHIIYIYISIYIHVHITYVCDMCIWLYAMYKLKKNAKPERKKGLDFFPPKYHPILLRLPCFFCRKIVMYIEGACLPTTWHGNQTTFVACQYLSLKTKRLKMCSRHDCRIAICYARGCVERSSKAKSLS